MEQIHWQDNYTVGILELDHQHQVLLGIINTLIDDQYLVYNAEKFDQTFHKLLHYAYTHFATEEKYLQRAQFPAFDQHVTHHIDFIMQLLTFALRLQQRETKSCVEILLFLKNWYSNHVLGIDRLYIKYVALLKQE
jgi:hemerythrin-like metal-binding protein